MTHLDHAPTSVLPNGLTVDDARQQAARRTSSTASTSSTPGPPRPRSTRCGHRGRGLLRLGRRRNRLLDFSSQLVFTNIGHQHPRVVAAIKEQAAKLCTIAPQHANDARSEAARLIAERTPDELNKVFFTNGGADANEHAVRMARLHTGRFKVLTAYRSYHGGTHTAINLTGDPRRWANDTATAARCTSSARSSTARSSTRPPRSEECERALAHLDEVIRLEGPATIAAIVLETIPGTAGIFAPPPGYLAGVRALCDEYGIVLIVDEVMAGFGRAGTWFALDQYDVTPDLITFAKGVNSGYVPLGGVIISPAIAETFAHRPYPGGLTYSGHPLACAAAVATINTMRDEGIVENAARLGDEVFGPGLAEIAARHAVSARSAASVRSGRSTSSPTRTPGSRWRRTAEPAPAMNAVVAACKQGGLLPFANFNRIHVVPPCTMSDEEAREGLAILDEALKAGDSHAVA